MAWGLFVSGRRSPAGAGSAQSKWSISQMRRSAHRPGIANHGPGCCERSWDHGIRPDKGPSKHVSSNLGESKESNGPDKCPGRCWSYSALSVRGNDGCFLPFAAARIFWQTEVPGGVTASRAALGVRRAGCPVTGILRIANAATDSVGADARRAGLPFIGLDGIALSRARVAMASGAFSVEVRAIDRGVDAAGVWITHIDRAGVVVVAIDRGVAADASCFALVDRAGIVVIAVLILGTPNGRQGARGFHAHESRPTTDQAAQYVTPTRPSGQLSGEIVEVVPVHFSKPPRKEVTFQKLCGKEHLRGSSDE